MEAAGGVSGGGDGLCSEIFVDVIGLADFLEGDFNLTVDSFDLFFTEGCLYNFFFFHENLGKDFIHVDSGVFVELVLVDHRDKVVHLLRVTETPRPYLELDMLILDAFDHVGEEEFYLILHGTELRNFGVGGFRIIFF